METVKSVTTAKDTEGCAIRMSQARPEIRVPSVIARKAGIFCVRKLTRNCSSDYYQRSSHQHQLGVGLRIDVVMNVERQNDKFLPINDPVSGKDHQKEHETRVGDDGEEVFRRLSQACGLLVAPARGSLKRSRTTKNIGKTLSAATRKTFSTRM